MANGPTNRVESLELRSVWPKEQQDFSAWLVENIDFLNEHLPFDVDPESLAQEQSAGDFYVDVVGDAVGPSGEDLKIVIENQLEDTDHKHLGQILTYVAAFDADAAIWISARARPEHAKAVQWLNDESNIEAWLFDIEVIKIGDSPPAPLLRRIIGPSHLSSKAKQERRATEAYKEQKFAFWETALPILRSSSSALGLFTSKEPTAGPYISQRAEGPGNIIWQTWVTSHGSWFCLRIQGETPNESEYYFDQLAAQKSDIEEAFGGSLLWQPLPEATGSVVRWNNPTKGGYLDTPTQAEKAATSLGTAMKRFVDALQSPVQELSTYHPDADEEKATEA